MSSEAFVTLATSDSYALGAITLAQSIRRVGTTRNLVVLISNSLSYSMRETLSANFDQLILVDELNSNDNEHLNLLSRPELGITFTKINCWLLEQYSKCVFLDADCLVLQNIDDLFEREELSAAPDAGWPDCFNSGVFVYRPSKETFRRLMNFASQQDSSFDGGDQGLLNNFFSNWSSADISRHLPFIYNVTANAFYSYLPAVTQFRNDIRIVHFAGALKPWQLTYNAQNDQLSGNLNGQSQNQRDFLLSWWKLFYQKVWPQLNHNFNLNERSNVKQDQNYKEFYDVTIHENTFHSKSIEPGSNAHRRAWESGNIDYYGRDSFANIQHQLEKKILQQRNYSSQMKQTTTILKCSINDVASISQTDQTNQTITSQNSQCFAQHTLENKSSNENLFQLRNSLSDNQQTSTKNTLPDNQIVVFFNKIFLGITYTISLCYLLFLFLIGKSNNRRSISSDVEPSVRREMSPSTVVMKNNEDHLKKQI